MYYPGGQTEEPVLANAVAAPGLEPLALEAPAGPRSRLWNRVAPNSGAHSQRLT